MTYSVGERVEFVVRRKDGFVVGTSLRGTIVELTDSDQCLVELDQPLITPPYFPSETHRRRWFQSHRFRRLGILEQIAEAAQ